jgi:tetratricopeptide (TPR) repeat protein
MSACGDAGRPRRGAGGLRAAVALGSALLAGGLAGAHESTDASLARAHRQIQQHPEDAALYLVRAELHRVEGDFVAAAADLKRARELDPGLPEADLYRGRLLLETGRFSEAEAAFRRFLGRSPRHAAARALHADSLARLERHSEAAEEYGAAIRLQASPSPEFYLGRAGALGEAGDVGAALRSLDEGLETLGPVTTLQLRAIDLELQRRDVDAALARLDRVAATSASQAPWLVRRGEVLELAGRDDEALRAYVRALSAIRELPGARRSTRAMSRLEARAVDAMRRLSRAAD